MSGDLMATTGNRRDTQRGRVYKAGWATTEGERFVTVTECQTYIDRLLAHREVVARWGQRSIRVHDGRGRRSAGGLYSDVWLPRWARQERTILHEVAHCLADEYDGHGPAFAAVFYWLTGIARGDQARRALGNAFYDHGVEMDLATIPKPDPARVRRVQERRREKAAAAERRRTRRATPGELAEAAATIRRAVRCGMFGPAGRKPRDHALATARLLEQAR